MKIREPKNINDSNDLLGYILVIQDKNGDFVFDKIIKKMGKHKRQELEKYTKELADKKYIVLTGTNEGHVYADSKIYYISQFDKIWAKIKTPLTSFFMYMIGLATDDIKKILAFISDLIIDYLK